MTIFSEEGDPFRTAVAMEVRSVCVDKTYRTDLPFQCFCFVPSGSGGGVWEAAPGASALTDSSPAAAIQVNVEGGELTGVHG